MRIIILICLLGCFTICCAQDTLTLPQCHMLASEYAPRAKDKLEITSITDLKIQNAVTGWYPELNLNGKFSYQSDVVEVALVDPSIPVEFPVVPYDQYSLNLDIRQTVYDGGMTRRMKSYEDALSASELQQVEVDIYKLKEQVNAIFFSVLILQENRKNMELTMENLMEQESTVQSGLEHGILLESDLRVLQLEKLRLRQSLVELDAEQEALIKMLGTLIGTELSDDVLLQKPSLEPFEKKEGIRPEYKWFDLQSLTLDSGKDLAKSKRMPRIFAFGQAGYGKPGYNMLSGDWDLYYMVGAGIKWNIWDWNISKRERMILEHKQNSIKNRQATFEQALALQLHREASKIQQYEKTITIDKKMLELQKDITMEAASKMKNGTITMSDYLLELNKENMARIRVDTDRILLSRAKANYMTLKGTL